MLSFDDVLSRRPVNNSDASAKVVRSLSKSANLMGH